MELLKKYPPNFRYCICEHKEGVDIFFYRTPSETIEKDETTIIESVYLPNLKEITRQVTDTVYDDEFQIDKFNDVIVEFLYKCEYLETVKITNCSSEYKLIFEPIVFETINKRARSLEVDLQNSAIRLGNNSYKPMNNFVVKSGIVFFDNDTTLTVDNLNIMYGTFTVYNLINRLFTVNIMVKNKIYVINAKIYASMLFTLSGVNDDLSEYSDIETRIRTITVFGTEYVEKDSNEPRILIQGFNDLIIESIEVENVVQYGSILKLDKTNRCSINNMLRNIDSVNPGALVTVSRVAEIDFHNVNVITTADNKIMDDFYIFDILSQNSGFQQHVNIYDSTFTNNTFAEMSLLRIRQKELHEISISDCRLNKHVNLFDVKNNCTINKMLVNKTIIISKQLFFNNIKDLTFNLSELRSDSNILLHNITTLGLINSKLFFKDMIIDYKDIAYPSLRSDGCTMTGRSIDIINPNVYSSKMFNRNNIVEVDKIDINNFALTSNGSIITASNISVKSDDVTRFQNTTLSLEKTNTVLNIYSSLVASIMLKTSNRIHSDRKNFALNIKDDFLSLNNNSITLMSTSDYPKVSLSTNVLCTYYLNGFDNQTIHFSMDENRKSVCEQSQIVANFRPIESKKFGKIINNSEKVCNIESDDNQETRVYRITTKVRK
jgi:hypothetical protein